MEDARRGREGLVRARYAAHCRYPPRVIKIQHRPLYLGQLGRVSPAFSYPNFRRDYFDRKKPGFFLSVRKMPDYTPNDIVDIILVLGECHNNYRQATVLYRNRFPQRQHPNDYTISKLVLRQQQRQRQKRQRRRINVPERDYPHVLAVLGTVGLNLHVLTRLIARELGISRSTILRILAIHNFHPYHITLTQLTLNDSQQRLEF